MKFFNKLEKATYLSRPNRFVVEVEKGKETLRAFLPNPGRLWELFFPGSPVYLEKSDNPDRKYAYTAVAVEREGRPVLLHTHLNNDVAQVLLEKKLVPGLEKAQILKREHKEGKSRFDFLLKEGKKKIFLEVKSCTLFSEKMAMFPDAVTSRGKRHVEELMELSKANRKCAVLFLTHSPQPDYFLPEYHTDLEFSQTLEKARKKVKIIALGLNWQEDLSLKLPPEKLEIPWQILEEEGEDRGSYLFLMSVDKEKKIEVGKLGTKVFAPGYYTYVGSAKKNLTKRIGRHRRKRKNKHWHIDYFRQEAEVEADLPFRTADDLECTLAGELEELADDSVKGFGASDCQCDSHLFYTEKNPLNLSPFHDFLQEYRMDRLVQ